MPAWTVTFVVEVDDAEDDDEAIGAALTAIRRNDWDVVETEPK